MTKKEYMERAVWLNGEIDAILNHFTALRIMTKKTIEVFSEETPEGTRRMEYGMEDTIDDILRMEATLKEQLAEKVRCRQEIQNAVNRVKTPECRMVLELRYLCMKKWEEIAEIMYCSRSNVIKLHRKALQELPAPPQEEGQGSESDEDVI